MEERRATLLRIAFLAGAVTDALALVPLLSPMMARVLWGFDAPPGPYRFAMGYAASLMAAWTLLLLWACQRPIERAFVAALTAFVIWGLVLTEVAAIMSGTLPLWRMAPTWVLQAALLAAFAGGYHYPAISSRLGASGLARSK